MYVIGCCGLMAWPVWWLGRGLLLDKCTNSLHAAGPNRAVSHGLIALLLPISTPFETIFLPLARSLIQKADRVNLSADDNSAQQHWGEIVMSPYCYRRFGPLVSVLFVVLTFPTTAWAASLNQFQQKCEKSGGTWADGPIYGECGIPTCDAPNPPPEDCSEYSAAIYCQCPEIAPLWDKHDGCIVSNQCDVDKDGVTPAQGDCDDTDPTRSANHSEWCDGLDNDCSGVIDNDCVALDGQEKCENTGGYWVAGKVVGGFSTCENPKPHCTGSCRNFCVCPLMPAAGTNEPGLWDNDLGCVPTSTCPAFVTDEDGDGVPLAHDCDDTDPSVPHAIELCNDGKDNNCNGVVDEGECYRVDVAAGCQQNGGWWNDCGSACGPRACPGWHAQDDSCYGLAVCVAQCECALGTVLHPTEGCIPQNECQDAPQPPKSSGSSSPPGTGSGHGCVLASDANATGAWLIWMALLLGLGFRRRVRI